MILSDFHIHSTFSDGKLSIPEIVDFFGSRGFGAIAITDHICQENNFVGKAAHYLGKTLTRATFPVYKEILKSEGERAWDQYQMRLIPGFELTKNALTNHRSAHVLALGVTDWISADLEIPEMSKAIRSQGGLSIAAHPLSPHAVQNKPFYLWDHRRELESEFDAWEVTYHATLLKDVMNSSLKKLASSDFHKPFHMTSWKTMVDSELHPQAILQAIKNQDLRFFFYEEEKEVRNSVNIFQADWMQDMALAIPS